MTRDWYSTSAGKSYNTAQKRAFTSLRQKHEVEFDILYLAMQQEVAAEEGIEALTPTLRRRAYSRALRRLGAQFRDEYTKLVEVHWVNTKKEARQKWLDSLDN